MHVGNTDALSHRNKSPDKCLQTEEKKKKKKYLESFLQQLRQFYPFILSVDDLLGVDTEAVLKCIVIHLATKWKYPYSRTCGYLKSRAAITLVRVIHQYIRESWVPSHKISVKRPQWEYGAGLRIFCWKRQKSKIQREKFILFTPSRHRKKVETHEANSEKQLWDAFNHTCDGIN